MDITSDEIGLLSTERNDNFLIMPYDKKATLIIVFQANEHIISWYTFFFFFLEQSGETKSWLVPSWNENVWISVGILYERTNMSAEKKINFESFYFRNEMGSISHVKWHHLFGLQNKWNGWKEIEYEKNDRMSVHNIILAWFQIKNGKWALQYGYLLLLKSHKIDGYWFDISKSNNSKHLSFLLPKKKKLSFFKTKKPEQNSCAFYLR